MSAQEIATSCWEPQEIAKIYQGDHDWLLFIIKSIKYDINIIARLKCTLKFLVWTVYTNVYLYIALLQKLRCYYGK